MMRAMPYNLQGKGVVEVSGIISQISSSVPPKWKSLDKLQEIATATISEEEEFEEQLQLVNTKKQEEISGARRASSIDSEPTSTLDTTRRSPSPPTSTSTSTLSSSFNNNKDCNNKNTTTTTTTTAAAAAAGVANPGACVSKEDWGSELHNLQQRSDDNDNVTANTINTSIGGDRLVENTATNTAAALEDWDTMFPTGDGALLPWIIGDAEDPSLGLKHLLQSASHVVDYEGNAGLGVVDQGPGFEAHNHSHHSHSHSHSPIAVVGSQENEGGSNSGFIGSEFGNNGKIGSLISPNSSSGVMDNPTKVSSNSGLNASNSLLFGTIPSSYSQQYEFGDEKPQIYNPQLVMNQQQAQSLANPSFLMPPLGYCQLDQHMGFQPPNKRHNPGVVLDPNLVMNVKNPFVDQGHELLLRKQQQQQQQHQHQVGGYQQLPMGLPPQLVPPHLQQKPMMSSKQNNNNHHHHQQQQQQQQHFPLPVLQQQQQQQQHLQEQFIKDTLYKAADLIQTGNFSLAQEILARLNHPLSLPAKPLDRAALYVKEALQMLLMMGNPVAAPSSSKNLTPYDVVHKMNAYKVFSEVSPITQFMNFTCTQAILEALDDYDVIHIIDFDIGCGAQWASFIQELPLRKRGPPSLKITAFTPLSTTHPFEIGLVRENLVQFANDIGVPFELQVLNLDSFDPSSCSMPNFRASEEEAIAVSIPVWSSSNRPSILPPILEFIKQRSPKIIVSLDRGFDRYDVPFPQHLVHALDSCTQFLESLDGHVASDIVTKVEKFFVQPRIENTILGRVQFPEKMPHWKNLFASAGFSPMQFSNFTETQADYVVKRTPGRGFHVEKRQASLVLSWQRRELVAASAWRC
ncbi:Scarecrow-like protein 6 [Bienertia sinuspersici]